MGNPVLDVVMRYLHIVSAIMLLGGLTFLAFVLRPALNGVDASVADTIRQAAERRFRRLTYLCFAGLFVSGVYNWMLLARVYKEVGKHANAVIGIKVLLALIAFLIVWTQAIGLMRLPGKACRLINIHLAAIIVLLAGLLRYWRG